MRAGSGPVVDDNDMMNASSPRTYALVLCPSLARTRAALSGPVVLKRGDLHAHVGGPPPLSCHRFFECPCREYQRRDGDGGDMWYRAERFGKLLASRQKSHGSPLLFRLSRGVCLPPRCLLFARDDCIKETRALLHARGAYFDAGIARDRGSIRERAVFINGRWITRRITRARVQRTHTQTHTRLASRRPAR